MKHRLAIFAALAATACALFAEVLGKEAVGMVASYYLGLATARGECGLGGGGDLHRPAPGLSPTRRRSRRVAPELEALARFERLREAVGGLEFDVEGGNLHGRTCALRGDRC